MWEKEIERRNRWRVNGNRMKRYRKRNRGGQKEEGREQNER